MRRPRVVLAGVIALLAALLLPPAWRTFWRWEHERSASDDVPTCSRNLGRLADALHRYAEANGGAFPDSLDAVRGDPDVGPDRFECPAARRRHDHTLAGLLGLAGPMPASYRYLGAGLTLRDTRGEGLLLVERGDCHADPLVGDDVLVNAQDLAGNPVELGRRPNGASAVQWAMFEHRIADGDRPVRWPTPAEVAAMMERR